MTDTTSKVRCRKICTPKGSVDQNCDCSWPKSSRRSKAIKYGAGFITLCALCCAVPPALIALGFVSIATGAYIGAGATASLVVFGVLGLGYLLMHYVKKNL